MFKTPKIRSAKHRKFVSEQPCMITGYQDEGVDPHHLLRSGGKSMGTKACDSKCIPLMHKYHMELHANGDEVLYLDLMGIGYDVAEAEALRLARLSPCKKIREAVNG